MAERFSEATEAALARLCCWCRGGVLEHLDCEAADIRTRIRAEMEAAVRAEREGLPYGDIRRWLEDLHRLAVQGSITMASDEGYQLEQTIAAIRARGDA